MKKESSNPQVLKVKRPVSTPKVDVDTSKLPLLDQADVGTATITAPVEPAPPGKVFNELVNPMKQVEPDSDLKKLDKLIQEVEGESEVTIDDSTGENIHWTRVTNKVRDRLHG